MSSAPRPRSDGPAEQDDPALRLFRGERAIEAATGDAPPRELRILVQQLWTSAVAVVVLGGGAPWLLVVLGDRFPVEVAWIMTPIVLVIGLGCAVLAIQLRRGSERTRAFLAGPRQESAMDVFVLGGYWMFTRERLRTPAVRAWFQERERARRSGGPR